MKLLLDENLSRRLIPFLQADFPGSTQVALAGLERADDQSIWHYAKDNGFVIVTRDGDFEELAAIRGAPPQVIWLRVPNQAKSAVLNLLLKHRAALQESLLESGITCIELGPQGVRQ